MKYPAALSGIGPELDRLEDAHLSYRRGEFCKTRVVELTTGLRFVAPDLVQLVRRVVGRRSRGTRARPVSLVIARAQSGSERVLDVQPLRHHYG
jgi:hypothetical protein